MTAQSSTMGKSAHIHTMRVPKRLQKEWKKLFTKQLYCMGQDIRHGDNLLLRYGFTRQRPPNPDMGSSQYSLITQNGQVLLWGFGMMFSAKNDGLFLWRHEFEPKFVRVSSLLPNTWSCDQLPRRTMPKTAEEALRMLQVLVESMRWLESYENWVHATCGQSYRSKSLQGEYASDPVQRMDEAWRKLSEEFAKILKPQAGATP